MEDVPALIKILSREGHLSNVVGIHLGNNRPFEAPVFDNMKETLLAQGIERGIFIKEHRTIGCDGASRTGLVHPKPDSPKLCWEGRHTFLQSKRNWMNSSKLYRTRGTNLFPL